ncbi:MAG: nucleoid occlusion protein [Bacillota bacterium]|uniref:Nucleoid occlusion protein n=3 Tax=Fictibacillus TaxID=1329200 RepID=A0A168WCW5_9BACL|nr:MULTISPECIES: nucleoid occlusion protein [Fictibacillus]MBN3553614.1 nucleoid occlusion protein [Fictibacillus nanhaiensis]ANC79195.1 nucleoid occlusion protein [Fictibacillus phosphorivorans]MBH0164640.1 nucleoid occlusion protein [Fictibacillus sp. 7GRE50]MBH0168770.1 nucleoid occlusion protein [Fictibacillus sp. 18YEL24]MBH0175479.1 nucleoid occlusion protein [Fictibacillus sp. 23RED33]
MKHPFSRLFGIGEKSQQTLDPEPAEKNDNEEVLQLPVQRIIPNRFQPRTVFIDERIEELSQTIEAHGIIQPIVVRGIGDDKYELIAGERRWRAVQKLGWEKIPAIIKEMDDSQTASVALIENLQREELTAIEEAMAYAKLLELHGLTQEGLAQKLGKGQSTIANKLRLLKLPQSIQDALLQKKVTERHARALIVLKSPEKMEAVLQEIIEKQLNVKQTEERVKRMIESETAEKKPQSRRKSYSKDMRLAINTVRQSVDMVVQSGLSIDTEEEEHEEFYQFTIRIPKK